MPDTVNALRDRSYAFKAKDPLCEQAASEIEGLRAEKAQLEKRVEELEAENQQLILERLRAIFSAPDSVET